MGKAQDQKESEAERALASVAMQEMDRFETVWRPQQQRVAQQVVADAAPGSFARRRAETMVRADTSAAFAGARENLGKTAAARGEFGSSRHKLGLAGIGDDQAVSSGTGAVAADQAADTSMVAGLGTVTALGRGEKATAMAGMADAARIGAAQARSDAERSFQSRAGNARLAAQVGGIGAGLYLDDKQEAASRMARYRGLGPVLDSNMPESATGAGVY